jgi:hypothetical protein
MVFAQVVTVDEMIGKIQVAVPLPVESPAGIPATAGR